MARKVNYPTCAQPDIESDRLAEMTKAVALFEKLPPVDDADAIEKRINYMFDTCVKYQLRPTVSMLCLALGHPRQTLWKWQQRDDRRGALIARAKSVLETLMEQWMIGGKINTIGAIFSLKYNHQWKDVVSVETVEPNRLSVSMTPEQIAAAIERDIPIDIPEPEAAEIIEGGL